MMKVVGICNDQVEILCSNNDMKFMAIESFRRQYGEPYHGMVL